MKTAWVMTLEGTRHPSEVIGIVSARKGASTVREYVEWLYALLNYGPREHLDLARYNNSFKPYQAQYWTTNTRVPVQSLMVCGHNPYLEARLATNVVLVDPDGEQPILEWIEPQRIVCDRETGRVIEKVPGKLSRAPVRLPLHIA